MATPASTHLLAGTCRKDSSALCYAKARANPRLACHRAGTVYYAVLHSNIFTRFGPYDLAFEALAPSSSDVLFADPNYFMGGLVANGSFSVPAANEWVAAWIQPPCIGSLCQQSMHGLLGGTAYKVRRLCPLSWVLLTQGIYTQNSASQPNWHCPLA
jgi:hypothetical protein